MAVNPYYQDEAVTLFCGDCREIVPELGKFDLLLTDPPYGMKWDGNVSCGKSGHGSTGNKSSLAGETIIGDDEPFDPSPWLSFPRVIMFGCNHYAQRLPVGTMLVWIKRLDPAFGTFLSDAEVAWMKGGHGVYCYRDTSMMSITRNKQHPTQKPVGLMAWCIEKAGDDAQTILDPFAGSGTTGRAAKDLGRKAVLIEIEERYCEIAANRMRQEVLI